MGRIQRGYVYEASGSFYVRYWATVIIDGRSQRVQRSERLCEKNDKYYGRNAKAVKLLRDDFMHKQNQQQASGRSIQQDMAIADFWERFKTYCEEIVPKTGKPRRKPSTMRGYKQVWNQHLKNHFGTVTLQEYEPYMGTQFLQGLTGTQNKNTLKHIKGLGSALFTRAVLEQRVKVNPWHEVALPEDAIEPERTRHYTLEEAENIISALVDHVDCQLIMALACFLGLRPGEIAALRWEDLDEEYIHIRRSIVLGKVDTPKTAESVASLPLIDQVRVPLVLWRQKSGNPTDGWVFGSSNNTPVDLGNITHRVIMPHVDGRRECVLCKKTPKKSGVAWKSLYAGRRGACTAVIEHTGGNFAVAQALLRHKSMTTTLNVYKKAITPDAFKAGMKMLEAAASKK